MIDMVGKLCLAMGYRRPFVAKCCSLVVRVRGHYTVLRESCIIRSCEIRSTQTVGAPFGGSISRSGETKSHFPLGDRGHFRVAIT